MAANQFVGKWESAPGTDTGFDAMMTAIGITDPNILDMFKRKRSHEFSVDGDNWTLKMTIEGVPGDVKNKFKLDEWTDFHGMGGETYDGHVSLKDNVLTEISNPKSGKPGVTTIRTLQGNAMDSKQVTKSAKGEEVAMTFKMKRV